MTITTVTTSRLIIRPYCKSDYGNWLTQYEMRLPAQHKYDEGKMDMSICTEDWFHWLVDWYTALANEDKEYIFGVFRKEDNASIGAIDFSTLMRGDFQWARIGYTIHNQFWQQGYGKESVQAALNIAFEQLHYHRVEAHIHSDNEPSRALAESIGMEYECTRKGFYLEEDQWVDHLIYYCNAT